MQTTNSKAHVTKIAAMAAMAAASVVISITPRALAAPFAWDGSDAGNSTNWSDGLNWNVDAAPSAPTDVVTFDNTSMAATSNLVDAALPNTSFAQLNYRHDDVTKTFTTSIDRGVTLTLNGSGLGVGSLNTFANLTNSSFIVMPTNTATNAGQSGATVVIGSATAGSGTLGAMAITSGNVIISGRPGAASTNASYAILDLSGLDSFRYQQNGNSIFAVGQGTTANGAGTIDNGSYYGKLILGTNTNIAVNRFIVGGQNNAGTQGQQPVSTVLLGQNNNISMTLGGNEYIGSEPNSKDGSGALMFRSGLVDPVVNIGDNSATLRNGLEIARGRVGTSHSQYGVVDLTSASGGADGTINGYFAAVTLGAEQSGTAGAGGGFGMLSVDRGFIDNTGSMVLGRTTSAPTAGSPSAGILNVGVKGAGTDAGGGLVSSGSIILGHHLDASVNTPILGVINIANTGAVMADRIYVGNNTQASAGSPVTAVINLGGGTLTAGQLQAGMDATVQVATNRLINFNGGALKVKTGTTFGATFMQGMTAANVYAGGGTIDTNGVDTTINQALVAPAGDGLGNISITTGGSGYRAAPIVLVTGGGGIGATAVATIDGTTGAVSGIQVTNPGTGYTSAPTIQLIANGGTSFANIQTPYGGTAATVAANLATNTGGGINKVGAGKLTLTGANTYTGTTGIDAGTLVLTPSAHAPVLSGPGGADVRGGKLVFDYTGGTTPATAVQAGLASGYANSFASGQIHSSTATSRIGLGWVDDATSQITVARAYYGDANLDGTVDTLDFNSLAANFGGTGKAWSQADFNYDGIVDTLDFNNLAANFGQQLSDGSGGGGAGALVPEPASVGLLIGGGMALLAQRRRRRTQK